jgi:chemotaxis protein CheD
MEPIVVGTADCAIAEKPGQVLATYALGSCIALALYDPGVSVGGLLHFMLPDSSLDRERARANPFMFADAGIALLLERMSLRGAARLVANVAGGARLIGGEDVLEIGRRNYLATRRILWKAGILLRGEAIGGTMSRNMYLEIGTGKVWVDQPGGRADVLSGRFNQGGALCRTGS